MKDGIVAFLLGTGIVIAVIGLIALIYAFSGLVFWGLGTFIIWAFGINFVWTFWHGLAVAFIVNTLTGIFGGRKREE